MALTAGIGSSRYLGPLCTDLLAVYGQIHLAWCAFWFVYGKCWIGMHQYQLFDLKYWYFIGNDASMAYVAYPLLPDQLEIWAMGHSPPLSFLRAWELGFMLHHTIVVQPGFMTSHEAGKQVMANHPASWLVRKQSYTAVSRGNMHSVALLPLLEHLSAYTYLPKCFSIWSDTSICIDASLMLTGVLAGTTIWTQVCSGLVTPHLLSCIFLFTSGHEM